MMRAFRCLIRPYYWNHKKINPIIIKVLRYFCNVGRSLNNLERYEEAVQMFDEALKLNPENSYAYIFKGLKLHINIGDALDSLERYEEAI